MIFLCSIGNKPSPRSMLKQVIYSVFCNHGTAGNPHTYWFTSRECKFISVVFDIELPQVIEINLYRRQYLLNATTAIQWPLMTWRHRSIGKYGPGLVPQTIPITAPAEGLSLWHRSPLCTSWHNCSSCFVISGHKLTTKSRSDANSLWRADYYPSDFQFRYRIFRLQSTVKHKKCFNGVHICCVLFR